HNVWIDDVALQPVLGPMPPTQSTSGALTLSDPDVNDTHSATFVPENNGLHTDGTAYLGTLTLDPIAESGGGGSVPWHFTVDRADIHFLAPGQVLQQFYDVTIADGHGGSATQTIEVDVTGTNDAPAFTGGATTGSADEIDLATNDGSFDGTSGIVT